MKKILLSLGAIAAVITPIAAVISCGANSLKDEIKKAVEKIEATDFPTKEALVESVKGSKTVKELQDFMDKIFPKDETKQPEQPEQPEQSGLKAPELTPMDIAKKTSIQKIKSIHLPAPTEKKFIIAINMAETKEAIEEQVTEAQKNKDELMAKNKAAFMETTRSNDLASVAKMKILLKDKLEAIKLIEDATDMNVIENAFNDVKAKEIKPSVKNASKDGFVITNKDGFKLYIPNGEKGTSVTLVDTTTKVLPQSIFKYIVTEASTKTKLPIVKLLKDDETYSEEKIVVSKAKETDLILRDYSGTYYSKGNVEKASQILLNFINANLIILGKPGYDEKKIKELLSDVVHNINIDYTLTYDDRKITSCIVGIKGHHDPDFGSTTDKTIERTKDFNPLEGDFLPTTQFSDGPDFVDFGSNSDPNIDRSSDFAPTSDGDFSPTTDFADGDYGDSSS